MYTSIEENFKHILQECFSNDKELLEKYHIYSGKGLDECVDKTFNDLNKIKDNYTFYKVEENNNLIGFFGIEDLDIINGLTGFFIVPEYRKRKNEFWELINNKMEYKEFICGIYKKNIRAEKFLKDMNGKVILENDDSLIFKMESRLCH